MYTWAKDGAQIYAIRSEKQHYVLAAIAAGSGAEKTLVEFDLPAGSTLGAGLSLAPDGRSVTATLSHVKGDIWLLQGFRTPAGLLQRVWRW
jgi:hypothetical protein